MNNKTSNQSSLDATYVINPASGEMKVVVKTKNENDTLVATHQAAYVKTHYSIDTNGGGYTGL